MSEELAGLLEATTVSASGLDITIACDDHDTKDAILNALTAAHPRLSPDLKPLTHPAE